jgi:biopolymer transport protein ExbD
MVDVVMVILVFFMASAAFLGPEWYLKSLVPLRPGEGAGQTGPAGRDELKLPPVRLEIALRPGPTGGALATGLGLTDAPLDTLLARLAQFAEGTPKDQIEVLVQPGPGVAYRDVVLVHEGCTKAGIARVGVGLNAPPTPPR